MVEGHWSTQSVFRREKQVGGGDTGIVHNIVVGQHGAFGKAGCAGCVKDVQRIFRFHYFGGTFAVGNG